MNGVVKSYSNKHGYGFIVGDRDEIFFAHKFYFRYKDPKPGDKVTFDPVEHDKGMRAKNIRREKSWETK